MFRAVTACMIGSAFEWYDFALYGYFAAVLGKLFFPSADPLVSLLATYGVFAAGFAMRPVGAVIFGHVGDKYGRKKALVATIFLMTFPTVCLGLLPTYDHIGILAPILLTVIRLCQGLSIGGNLSGSFTFMIEYAPGHRRGLVGSLTLFSALGGILIGSAMAAFATAMLDTGALETWGWRIPFLIGVLIGGVGFYMRIHIPETPQYVKEMESEQAEGFPLKKIIKEHPVKVIRSIFVLLLNDVGFYVSFIFLTTYMTTIVKIPMDTALTINTINMVILMSLVPVMGWVSDHVGRKPMMMLSSVMFFVLAIPVFNLIDQGGFWPPLFGQMLLGFSIVGFFGAMAAMLVEKFPTKGRYSALSLTINISATLFGGTAPFIVTSLMADTGWNHIPAYYLMAAGLISFIALLSFKDRFRDPLL
ncbi:MAG: MFS transporter [Alphaproteobacteria bacterium]|jgi:MFS transporter, MHS family, proline/betaine transporter|nr:MFS transporter [Alphaproteobacteria bacterium]MBT5390047.1 MFS transporter [Alphaproteobacteria bacterium]